jgi:hypothetical protein
VNFLLRAQLHLSMASSDGYDYLGMSHFIVDFQKPFTDKPFISKIEENYKLLWQIRDFVVGRSLGVSRYKGYTHLLHKESILLHFYPSMYWRKSFSFSSSMASTLSLEFKR